MAEYIEREYALTLLRICADSYGLFSAERNGCMAGHEWVRDIPAADVAPVRHGRWELHGIDDVLSALYFCSLCGYNIDEEEFLDRRSYICYCPHCGAKMEVMNDGV